ncbi:unnamed protein product [Prunus armeniaca]
MMQWVRSTYFFFYRFLIDLRKWWPEVRERALENFQKNYWNRPVSWLFSAIEGSEVVRLGPVLPETMAGVGSNLCLKLASHGGRKREENLGF